MPRAAEPRRPVRAALPLPAAPQARERPLWGRGGQAAGEQGSREAGKQGSKQASSQTAGWLPPLSSAEESPGGALTVRVPRRDPRGPPCARLLRGAAASRYSAARRGAGSSWRAALCGVGCERIELGTVRRRQLLNMSLLPLYLLGLLLSSGQGRSGILFLFF